MANAKETIRERFVLNILLDLMEIQIFLRWSKQPDDHSGYQGFAFAFGEPCGNAGRFVLCLVFVRSSGDFNLQ